MTEVTIAMRLLPKFTADARTTIAEERIKIPIDVLVISAA